VGFWRFADEQALGGLSMLVPSYDPRLGWIAGLLAVVAGFALFPTLARVHSSRTALSRGAWVTGGAVTMGIGFWGTQNVALLGFQLPTWYWYEPLAGFAAILPVIAGCAGAILALQARARAPLRLHLAAASLAAGIAAMHFTLMEAIRGDLLLAYDPSLALQSVALGYAFALVALYVSRAEDPAGRRTWVRWAAGSLLLGLTVLANHFTAMGGATFFDDPAVASSGVAVAPPVMLPLIGGCVLFLVTAFWLGSVVDGRLGEASAAVRSSEARHRAIVETMLDAHMITDSRGIVHSVNPAAEAAFGWRAEEIVGQPVTTLVGNGRSDPARDWADRSGRATRLPPSGRRWVFAQGGRRKDGTLFPIEVAVSPFEVDGERFFSCTVRDLGDSWAAETKLRRLAAAIEHAGDGIAILDTDHRVLYVNPQYERQTGMSQDEVVGRRPERGASDPSVYAEIWQAVAAGRTWAGQVRNRRRDGTLYDEELTVTPVPDATGAVSAYVAVMRDVTRRIEADLERRRLAEALQYCTDAIEILDAQGRIVYVNAALEQATGQRLADIRGSRPEALTDFGPAGAAYDDMLRTAYRGGRPWSGTLKSTGPDGVTREEDVTVSPIRDDRAAPSGFVVVKRDTTVRRRLEAQARQRQKLASLSQLADGIARELNAPMRQLTDNLRFLGDSFGHLDRLLAALNDLARSDAAIRPAALAGCLQSADVDFLRREINGAIGQSTESAQRMDAVVRAMRDVAAEGPARIDLDLNRAVQGTITVTAGEWQPVAEICTELDDRLPPLYCVPGEIGMVLLNALLHAVQAASAGNRTGIRGKAVVTVATRLVNDWAEIRVAWAGKAVTDAARQALFDPAPGADGGLPGMALAHEIVVGRQHGTIALESDGDRGAAIVIRMPLERPDATGDTAIHAA
jgi:PAS domain S-box-containing protein